MFADELGTGDRLLSIAGGVLLLFLGVAMLSSHLVRPIARVVGLPARSAGGAAGRLASGNAIRNPGADRRDRGGADDRDRARRVHRDADERDEGVEPRGDRGAGRRRLRRDLARRLHAVRLGRGRRARGVAGARDGDERSLRRGSGERRHGRDRRHRAGHDRRGVRLRLEGRRRRASLADARHDERGRRAANFADDHDIAVGDVLDDPLDGRARPRRSRSSGRSSRRRSTRCSRA